MMARKMSENDTEKELRAAFDVFDSDHDGVISASELRQVLNSLGEKLTDAEIDDIVKEADQDDDGTIDCNIHVHLNLIVWVANISFCC